MPDSASSNQCLRDWDLADHTRIDDAIALWCGVEPAELAKLNFDLDTRRVEQADAKCRRALLELRPEQTAKTTLFAELADLDVGSLPDGILQLITPRNC